MPQMQINLLGELSLLRDGAPISLPQSRKTRALLAYLALTGRPHRRERLCEMLWDLPDDPRGSLRWALSKIRLLVDEDERQRLEADRERAGLSREMLRIDYVEILRALQAAESLPLSDLQSIAQALALPLLDGLDLPNQEIFQAWLTAERDEALRLRIDVLRRLCLHPRTTDKDAVKWLRLWQGSDPVSEEAAAMLSQTLKRLGRFDEADEAIGNYRRTAGQAGIIAVDNLQDHAPMPAAVQPPTTRNLLQRQSIGFCLTADGVRIAHATVGEGPTLVKAANWLNHLELDWQGPIWGKTFQALAAERTLVRYDERGNGLSDWNVAELGLEAFVRDLETVVDALGLRRFPLLGISQGCAVSIDYAVRHPDRVSALVLVSGYATGWRVAASPEERERREAVKTLTRLGWGTDNPAYRHIFSQTFMPDGTPEELAWFDELQRQTTSAENAVRFQDAFGDIDVRHLLAHIQAPTLVLHARHDQRISIEQGRDLAANIPGARFVALESRSHIILEHEPAWTVCMKEMLSFLREHGSAG